MSHTLHIARLELSRFGHFASHGQNLSPGLTLVTGPNEAGKSTLLTSLGWLLFDLPRNHARHHLAKGASGTLDLRTPDGLWRVFRHGKKVDVTTPDNQSGQLRQLFGALDRAVFDAVFAFDLDELANAKSLTGDALKERLFAAGLTGGGPSVHDVRKRVKEEIGLLWKPRADCEVKRIRTDLKERRRAMREAQCNAKDLPRLLQRIDQLESTKTELAVQAERAVSEHQSLGQLLSIHADFQRLLAFESELAGVPAAPRLDGASWTGIERLQEVHIQAQVAFDERNVELEEARAALDSVRRDEAILNHSNALGTLVEALSGRREDHRATSTATSLRSQVDADKKALGCDTDDALAAIRIDPLTCDPLVATAARLVSTRAAVKERERAAEQEVELAESAAETAEQAVRDAETAPVAAERQPETKDLASRWRTTISTLSADHDRLQEAAEAATLTAKGSIEDIGGRQVIAAIDACGAEALDRWAEADSTLAVAERTAQAVKEKTDGALERTRQAVEKSQIALEGEPSRWPGLPDAGAIRTLVVRAAEASRARATKSRLDNEVRTLRTAIGQRARALGLAAPQDAARIPTDAPTRERIRGCADALRRADLSLGSPAPAPSHTPSDAEIEDTQKRRDALRRLRSRLQDSSDGMKAAQGRVVSHFVGGLIVALIVLTVGVLLGIATHLGVAVGAGVLAVILLGLGTALGLASLRNGRPWDLTAAMKEQGLPPDAGYAEVDGAIDEAEGSLRALRDARALAIAHQTYQRAVTARDEAQRAYATTLDRAALSADTPPDDVMERLAGIASLQSDIQTVISMEKDARAAHVEWTSFEHDVDAVATRVGVRRPADTAADVWMDTLRRRLDEAEKLASRLDRLGLEHRLLEERMERAKLEHAEALTQLDKLAAQRAAIRGEWLDAGIPTTMERGGFAAWLGRVRDARTAARNAATTGDAAIHAREILAAFDEDLGTLGRALGVQVTDRAATIAACEARCDAAAAAQAHAEKAQDRLAEARKRVAAADRKRILAEADADAYAADLGSWTQQAEGAGYADPTPDTFETRVATARRGQKALSEWQSAVSSDQERAARLVAFQEEVTRVHVALDLAPPRSLDAALAAVENLQTRLSAARDAETRYAAHAETVSTHEARMRSSDDKARKARDELQQALTAQGLPSVDHARIAHDHWARAVSLEAEIATVTATIQSATGRHLESDGLRSALRDGDPVRWQDDRERLAEERRSALEQRDEALKDLSTVTLERDGLLVNADIPRLATEISTLETELRDVTVRLAALQLTDQLLERSVERYRKEQQPAVLRRAGDLLSRITQGAWTSVRPSLDAPDVLEVVSPSGEAVPPEHLSRGTREQLYLCLRLALAENFGDDTTATPPIVLDDVLVNFDPERAVACADVLAEVARTHQVVLFSCRPETADALLAVEPATHVVSLPRFGGASAPVVTDAPTVQTPTARRSTPSTTGFEQIIVERLQQAGTPLAKSLLVRDEEEERAWTGAIAHLRDDGVVDKIGRKRGTRWALSEWSTSA